MNVTAFVLRPLLDAPFCRPGQHRLFGVARHEEARISCDVDANPSSGVHFRWLFNSSAGVMELPGATWTADGTRSVARYLPSSDLDFGSLLCSAHNAIGHQAAPCVYHIIPAGKSIWAFFLQRDSALCNLNVRSISDEGDCRPARVKLASVRSAADSTGTDHKEFLKYFYFFIYFEKRGRRSMRTVSEEHLKMSAEATHCERNEQGSLNQDLVILVSRCCGSAASWTLTVRTARRDFDLFYSARIFFSWRSWLGRRKLLLTFLLFSFGKLIRFRDRKSVV